MAKARERGREVAPLPRVIRDVERQMTHKWANRFATGEFNIENLHGDDPTEGFEPQDFDALSVSSNSGFQIYPTLNHYRRSQGDDLLEVPEEREEDEDE